MNSVPRVHGRLAAMVGILAASAVLVLNIGFSRPHPAVTHQTTPIRTLSAHMIQPLPLPSSVPVPVAGQPGNYYITCYSTDMTPACESAISFQPSEVGSTIQTVMTYTIFLCARPACNYRHFAPPSGGRPGGRQWPRAAWRRPHPWVAGYQWPGRLIASHQR